MLLDPLFAEPYVDEGNVYLGVAVPSQLGKKTLVVRTQREAAMIVPYQRLIKETMTPIDLSSSG
jgi:hypothetical protein